MLKDIIAVEPLENYQLRVRFEDGVEGIVDVSQMIKFTGVFASLQDQENFAKVEVNPEVGTVQWQSGADLDPDVLYATITKQSIPQYQLNKVTSSIG
ncbi:molybdopterin-guanine dinucleotide biosynthesis protein A [Nostocales cyanobacterium HT-58-2]|nr:molybdopterin-guanine dinucleotide biosynthesis protein A [Nostocales cyanobacterium HT-58-2]